MLPRLRGLSFQRSSVGFSDFRVSRKHEQVPIVVEGVERDFGAEWICQKHWSIVPTALRREYAQAKWAVKRLGDRPSGIASVEVWRRCEARATEIAFGLG